MSTDNKNPTTSESVADELQQPTAQPAAGDGVWDSLNSMHTELTKYSLAPALVAPLLRNREVVAKVADKQALLQNAELLGKDVTEFSTRLKSIHAEHAGRTGSSANADEQCAAIQTNEKYLEWIGSFDAVVMPTVLNLMGQLEQAGANLDEFQFKSPTELVDTDVDLDVDAGSALQEPSHAA